MNIETLFRNLSYGTLAGMNYSAEANGVIDEEKHERVLSYANEALLKLYSRFVLKEKDVVIEMWPHITNYHLKKRFAESSYNPDEERYPYIKDLPEEPFIEDVIKILAVYDSVGYQLPLNDREHSESLFTPQGSVLQVPHPRQGIALSALYQARHPMLVIGDLCEQEIELPDVLHPALYAHIAYQAYSSVGTDVGMAKSQEQLSSYENTCREAVENDLVSTSTSTTNIRFEKRGWK